MIDVSTYLGIPFKEHGRSFSGCDCLGIQILLWNGKRGINPFPDFRDSYESSTDHRNIEKCINKERQNWVQVPFASEWSVVVLEFDDQPHHIATCIGKDKGERKIFHVLNRTNMQSRIEKLDSPLWRDRIAGIYDYDYRNTAK